MKNELFLLGFSEISEKEFVEVDGGSVIGTIAFITGIIAIATSATGILLSYLKKR